MYVRSSGNRPATTTPRPVFAPSLGRLRRRRWPLGCWRPPPFDDELLERREEEEEEKETEAREVRKRGRCCCCFQGVVWARVAVVVAVKIISLYILYTTQKNSLLLNSFFCVCVWNGTFEIFFSFFSFFLSLKNTHTHTFEWQTHTLESLLSLCVCLCVSVVWLSFKRNNLTQLISSRGHTRETCRNSERERARTFVERREKWKINWRSNNIMRIMQPPRRQRWRRRRRGKTKRGPPPHHHHHHHHLWRW